MVKGKTAKPTDKRAPQRRAFATADSSLRISAQDFVAWQDRQGFSNNDAARAIFASPNSIAGYRAAGAGPDVALRCMAVEIGISPADGWEFIERAGKLLERYREMHP